MAEIEVLPILNTCPASQLGQFEIRARKAQKSRAAAMRVKCFECCAWQEAEARRCEIVSCALHSWNLRAWPR